MCLQKTEKVRGNVGELQNARHRAKSYTKPRHGETERSGKHFRGNEIRFGAESLFYILQVALNGL